MRIFRAVIFVTLLTTGVTARAAESLIYTYDAKGRLIKVVRSGSVNNGVQTQYTHDKANNRKRVQVTKP